MTLAPFWSASLTYLVNSNEVHSARPRFWHQSALGTKHSLDLGLGRVEKVLRITRFFC